jgi:hypothetical protein
MPGKAVAPHVTIIVAYQPQPGPKSFWVWRRLLLATAFLRGHIARVSNRTRNLDLRRPLGRWLPSSDAFQYQWTSFFSISSNSLFLLSADETGFHKHAAKKPRQRPKHPVRAFSADPTTWVATLPPDAIPVDHHAELNKLVFPDVISIVAPSPLAPVNPVTWKAYVASLQDWDKELLSSVEIINRRQLFEALQTATHLFLALGGGAADSMGSLIRRRARQPGRHPRRMRWPRPRRKPTLASGGGIPNSGDLAPGFSSSVFLRHPEFQRLLLIVLP